MIKYSIVIGALNHLEDCTRPCLESIKQYTDLSNVEVIVVANGCTDGTEDYVRSLGEPFKLLSNPEPMGYARANNWGMSEAQGEYIILLNNDAFLLEQPKNKWLEMLEAPFKNDPKMGITGPLRSFSPPGGRDFIVFFCVMICRELIDKLKLSTDYGVGSGEDTEYCYEAEALGYHIEEVPKGEKILEPNQTFFSGGFPIWHAAEKTVHDNPEWNNIFAKNSLTLAKKYNPSWYRWKLGNNSERAVFFKEDTPSPNCLESLRYKFAAENLKGKKVLEFGCSSGYALKFLPSDIDYTGVDYDPTIIEVAQREFGGPNRQFICCDVNKYEFTEHYDTIIAYEFIEHIDNGKELAQKLKQHCDTLILSVPYKESPGFLEPHHKLHNLSKEDFPGFEYKYVVTKNNTQYGYMSDIPIETILTLQLMKWERNGTSNMNKVIEEYSPVYSIIIPTAFDHLEKDLKPCIESIVEYTDLSQVEVIIVSNGSTDNTDSYVNSLGKPFKLLTYPNALGYAKAVNAGLKAATGKYIVLLNNDVTLTEQTKNKWLDILVAPCLDDPLVGITGPSKGFHKEANQEYITFYCALIRKEVVDQLKLNEEYEVGTCEDVEYCIETRNLGYKTVQVTDKFPLRHAGQSTMASLPPSLTNGVWERNAYLIAKKYNTPWYQDRIKNHGVNILAFVPTKNRYDSLALTLQSIALQTLRPDKILIYDDGQHKDLREDSIYKHIFKLLDLKGIKWEVIFGDGRGQHFGHEIANCSDYDLVWRIDDDEVAEPNVLEILFNNLGSDIGAVAGAVITPGGEVTGGNSKLVSIFTTPNIQWSTSNKRAEVEHLYSSFLYRTKKAHYNLSLSPVAHREETMFSLDLRKKGYKLLFVPEAVTYHFRQEKGGIRDNSSEFFFRHDEQIFKHYLESNKIKVISLDSGLGDHLAFLNVLPFLRERYNIIILGCCYPEVFKHEKDVVLLPYAATKTISEDNVYKWCTENNWKSSIIEAYKKMLGV